MENASTATAPAETTATAPTSREKFLKVFGKTRSVLKGAMGAGALIIGGALVLTTGAVFPILLGAAAIYTGGRSVFEAGKELLPLKAQSAISKFFTGKELTEITPVRQPKTTLGKIVRVAELVALTFTGYAAAAAGAFSLAWSGESAVATAYLYGGLATLAAGTVTLVDQAVQGVTSVVQNRGRDKAATAEVSGSAPAPDLAPASTLSTRRSDIAFNASAEMAALAQPAAVPQPKPPVVAPPQP